MGFRLRLIFLFVMSILMAMGVACSLRYSEPVDPIAITPVAYQTQTPLQTAVATAAPTSVAVATPTPTPWPIAFATHFPLPTATATPLSVPTAAPTPTFRPASTPVPTKISRWTQIQRDYKDKRITYDQAVEQAIDAGISRPHARIGLSQIRIP